MLTTTPPAPADSLSTYLLGYQLAAPAPDPLVLGLVPLAGCEPGEIADPLTAKDKGLTVCSGGQCYRCGGALNRDIPADGHFYLTSFGGPTDASTRGRRRSRPLSGCSRT